MRTIICEFSGGADSALAGIYATKKYENARFVALFVDYGQSYVEEELRASKALARKIFTSKDSWVMVVVHELFTSAFSGQKNVAPEYFPLRNLVIGSVAASLAVQMGADVIVNGSKSLSRVQADSYSFRDSTLPFYKMMEAAINAGLEEGKITIDVILADGRENKMTKKEVFAELISAGIDPSITWSCYHPVQGYPCGRCRNCLERMELSKGWQPSRRRD